MTTLTEQEVLDVLHAIERGEVTLDPEDVAQARGIAEEQAGRYLGDFRVTVAEGPDLTLPRQLEKWTA